MTEPVFELITPERLQNAKANVAIDWNICTCVKKMIPVVTCNFLAIRMRWGLFLNFFLFLCRV